MERYEWLLFLHVVAAFAIVAALVVFIALLLTTRSELAADRALPFLRLTPLARRLWDVGGAGTLVFGIWLAIDVDGYALSDGWIIAALVLWVIAAGAGMVVGTAYQQALASARDGAELPAAMRGGRTLALQAVMALAVAALLVVMIYKPGI